MECCELVTKCLSGVYAIFFAIAGLGLAAYGGLSTYSIYLTNSTYVIKTYGTGIPPIVITSFGIVLIILVLVGCCGIWRESPRCVETYSAFLLLLALSQLAFGGYCIILYGPFEYMKNLDKQIDTDINRAVQNYKFNPLWMDEIQTWMKCCGRSDPVKEFGSIELPATCCERGVSSCTDVNYYRDGCSKMVSVFTFGTNYIIGWISIIVGATEFIASLLGLCLSCCIWRHQMGSWR